MQSYSKKKINENILADKNLHQICKHKAPKVWNAISQAELNIFKEAFANILKGFELNI